MILRKMEAGYQFGTQWSSINHLLLMDDLKLYVKDEKQLDSLVNTVQLFSLDMGMEFCIDSCGILEMERGRYKKAKELNYQMARKQKRLM